LRNLRFQAWFRQGFPAATQRCVLKPGAGGSRPDPCLPGPAAFRRGDHLAGPGEKI